MKVTFLADIKVQMVSMGLTRHPWTQLLVCTPLFLTGAITVQAAHSLDWGHNSSGCSLSMCLKHPGSWTNCPQKQAVCLSRFKSLSPKVLSLGRQK